MDTSCRAVDISHIEDEVSDLSHEVILVGVPVSTTVHIWVGVDHSNTREAWACKEGW